MNNTTIYLDEQSNNTKIFINENEFGVKNNTNIWSAKKNQSSEWEILLPINIEGNSKFYKITDKSLEMMLIRISDLLQYSFNKMNISYCDCSFNVFIYKWISEHKYKWDEMTYKRKIKSYKELIAPFFYKRTVESIWKDDIEKWKKQLIKNYKPRYYEKQEALTVMRSAMRALYDRNYYHYDLSRHLRYVRLNHKAAVKKKKIPQNLIDKIFTGTSRMTYFYAITFLLRLRRGESCAISKQQQDLNNRVITINSQIKEKNGDIVRVNRTKNRRIRQILYTSEMDKLFNDIEFEQKLQKKFSKSYNNKEEYFFTEDDGSPITPRKFTTSLRNLTSGRVSPHDLRRLAATVIYEKRRSEPEFCTENVWNNIRLIESIADDLGHEDIRTTGRYILTSETGIKEIQNVISKWRKNILKAA